MAMSLIMRLIGRVGRLMNLGAAGKLVANASRDEGRHTRYERKALP